MKKYIMSLTLLVVAALSAGIAFADRFNPGDSYDPTSPGDPSLLYRLEVEVYPTNSGSTSYYNGSTFPEGSQVYLSSYNSNGYSFDGWYEGDQLVSSSGSFSYTMPARSVKLVAKFKVEDPAGPMEDGYTHAVKVTIEPKGSGSINYNNYFLMKEGEENYIYAYPNENYKFDGWKLNGRNVTPNDDGTPKNPLKIEMEDHNIDLVVKFSYSPNSPAEPWPNSYNRETFEMIVDNFYPGSLQQTINELVSDRRFNINRSEIHSIIIAGRMENSDRYFGYAMTQCSLVDLARTSGLTYIDESSIYEMKALSEIILPSSLTEIGGYTFYYNPFISSITCYAPVPPKCNYDFFQGFDYPDNNIATGVVAKVPASSLALYKEAPGWRHLNLQPIESSECSITVNLPEDAKDGRYKGMYIVLENPGSGQTQRFVINDRLSYVFENLIMNTEGLNLSYNVYLRNQEGDELASYPEISLTETNKDFTVNFTNVKSLNDLYMVVL